MKRLIIVVLCSVFMSICSFGVEPDLNIIKRIQKHVLDNGGDPSSIRFGSDVVIVNNQAGTSIVEWSVPGIPFPSVLPPDSELAIVDLPKEYIKIQGGKAVKKSDAEILTADAAYRDAIEDINKWPTYNRILALVIMDQLNLNDNQMKSALSDAIDQLGLSPTNGIKNDNGKKDK